MKNVSLSAALLTGLLATASCSSSTDSTKMAENANDNKIEKADSAGTAPMTASNEGDAKDVADYMVMVANTGRTEYQLSQMAASRATNAAVKDYASKTVSQHAQDEQELKAEAAKYNVTLPTTLSDDSQSMYNDLGKEQAGTNFDKKYLDDMADINDKAISKEKDLMQNTNKPELKAFIGKVMNDDQKHMAEAKSLKEGVK